MWRYANPNPCRQEEPDCVVRAICIAMGEKWHMVHSDLCRLSSERCTIPSANWLWGLYLKRKGFKRFVPDCPECTTVREFCRKYPDGTYIIGTGTHAICVINGDWYDTWDSGDEIPGYYWRRE